MPADRWQDADAYERYIGRWSRRAADEFLAWLSAAGRRRPGWTSAAAPARCRADRRPRATRRGWSGVDPSPAFVAPRATASTDPARASRSGGADALPLDDGAADAWSRASSSTSCPTCRAALAEAARVARPGGTVAAYVWDYAGRMELIRRFWDAAVELDPAAARARRGRPLPDRRARRRSRRRGSTPGWPRSSSCRSTSRPGSRTSTTLWLPFTVPHRAGARLRRRR